MGMKHITQHLGCHMDGFVGHSNMSGVKEMGLDVTVTCRGHMDVV